uniref:Uncharacterized protein n=1 Tax=virus sp. ctLpa4 TaxID=2825814 RepID=A0A8S5RM36_9VIRU|nr:MAG TPA: hypothetical protein [virus sp. ctLpa4]
MPQVCRNGGKTAEDLSGNYLLFMKTSDLQVKRDISGTNIQ